MSLSDQRIGRYKLKRLIASGGMADVYEAIMTGPYGFEKTVALKLMHKQISRDQSFISMFIDEARISAQLIYPNIVQIIDFGEVNKNLYIAMEYVNGVDLATFINALIKNKTKPDLAMSVYIVVEILDAINYTSMVRDADGNNANIVHRDITPNNILLSFDGDVKLTDFGIAKARGCITTTMVGTLKGKIRYMSPEQARGEVLNYRSDLYSIALILYELVTHKQAFTGDTDMTLLKHVQSSMIECLPTKINPSIPGALETTIMKALSAIPEDRFQSAESFKQALCQLYPVNSSTKAELSILLKQLFNNSIHQEPCAGMASKPCLKNNTTNHYNTIKKVKKWGLVLTSIGLLCISVWYLSLFKMYYKKDNRIKYETKNKPTQVVLPDKDATSQLTPAAQNEKEIPKHSAVEIQKGINIPRSAFSIIDINATPWARVYIAEGDSYKFIGDTPIKSYKIQAGVSRLLFKSRVYGIKTLEINVMPNDKKIILLRYNPQQKQFDTTIQ